MVFINFMLIIVCEFELYKISNSFVILLVIYNPIPYKEFVSYALKIFKIVWER